MHALVCVQIWFCVVCIKVLTYPCFNQVRVEAVHPANRNKQIMDDHAREDGREAIRRTRDCEVVCFVFDVGKYFGTLNGQV